MKLAILVIVSIASACRTVVPDAGTVANPSEGMAVLVYARGDTGFGIVDERRWITVERGAISLDRIDEAVPLPGLMIEPLAGGTLAIGTCVRERIDRTDTGLARLAQLDTAHAPERHDDHSASATRVLPAGVLSPLVRCTVTGAAGKHLVRLVYLAPVIRYRGQHDITMTAGDRASIVTRFALVTPKWNVRAEVALFDGLPGGDEPPREVAHGTVVLDGSTAVLSIPAVDVAAALRRVFDGAVRDRETPDTDIAWGRESTHSVIVWLELAGVRLSPGPVRAHVALPGEPVRDLVIAELDRERLGTLLRLPLWIDDMLIGTRRHTLDRDDDKVFSQHFELVVTNAGDTPHEVWIEERLRPSRRYKLSRIKFAKPIVTHGIVRAQVTVPPKATERSSFTVTYMQ